MPAALRLAFSTAALRHRQLREAWRSLGRGGLPLEAIAKTLTIESMSKKKSKHYRTEIYFVGGKMKKRKIPLIDGLETEEFIRRNADDIFLLQEGYCEILHERERQRNKPQQSSAANNASASSKTVRRIE